MYRDKSKQMQQERRKKAKSAYCELITSQWKENSIERTYGFYWDCFEKERVRTTNEAILKNLSEPSATRFAAAVELIRLYFIQSAESWGFDKANQTCRPGHPKFNKYISMILYNQDFIVKKVGKNVYNLLKQKYGTCPGIKDGQTYYLG